MEVYDNLGKGEQYPDWPKPTNTPVVFYNNYFDEGISPLHILKQKKTKDRDSLKNTSQVLRENKMNDSNSYQRSNNLSSAHGARQTSGSVRRVSSAKSRNDKKERRIVYECAESKKSLKVDRSKDKA